MPLSNPVVRRYTPPTCTLQIVDRSSPLSRWVGRSVSTLSEFDLRLDDPRLPEEQRVNLQGNQNQLTALQEAVTTYVQNLLHQSPEKFATLFTTQPTTASDSVIPSIPDSPDTTDAAPVLNSAFAATDFNAKEFTPQDATVTPLANIYLQPGRGLSHYLFLGSLATPETGKVIELSTLQLFDLATALDEYASDVIALPPLSRPRRSTSTPFTTWAGIAAMLLLGVGLTTAVVQVLNRSNSPQRTADRQVAPGLIKNNQQQIALQPSPTPPLSSVETLPSLPPVGSTSPSATASLPSTGVPASIPPLQGTAPLPPPPIPIPSNSPGNAPTPGSPILRTTTPPTISISPYRRQSGAISIPGETTVPGTSSAPDSPNIKSSTNSPSPTLPQISSANIGKSAANQTATPPAASSTAKTTTAQRLKAALERRSPNAQPTPNQPNNPAIVAAASEQIQEAKDYFNQRWQPPSGLQQTLEYSVVLDVDGTIQRIEPLGQAARTYVDRTGMPLIGERFVSPNPIGQTPRIRVVLSPDGKVQTFLEEEQGSKQSSSPKQRQRPF